ncbi:hypothetical protein MRX96_010821 [Rhipicephalus microplus]
MPEGVGLGHNSRIRDPDAAHSGMLFKSLRLSGPTQQKLCECRDSGDMRREVLYHDLVRVLAAARNLHQQRASSPEVELRLNHARQFVAGLAPNPVDMDALEEELGPDPYFELQDV